MIVENRTFKLRGKFRKSSRKCCLGQHAFERRSQNEIDDNFMDFAVRTAYLWTFVLNQTETFPAVRE